MQVKRMKIDLVKISPTENMTILVKTPIEEKEQLYVGTELMKYGSVYAEQVGFIEAPINAQAVSRLRMMAGEFCGNATMALAAYKAFEQGRSAGEKVDVVLEVSGVKDVLVCRIEVLEKGRYAGTVSMPLPLAIEDKHYIIGGEEMFLTTIIFEGIKHIILPKGDIGNNFQHILETSIAGINNQINEDVYGIIVFDEDTLRIDPLVSVQSAGSFCWERGCGSGSEAVGIYLACKYKKSIRCDIKQPGGVITVDVEYTDQIEKASITGNVEIVLEGTAYIG